MKKLALLSGLCGMVTFFFAGVASANVPSLQVSPLSYTGNLRDGVVESGYIDVANPSDDSIQVTSSVQGFRQIDTKGDLSFFDSATLAQGINVNLPNFTLGPREAIRVGFTIDPSKLPEGGVYGAIFFRTVPTAQNSSSSYILQSANVGTLLLLNNGHTAPSHGSIQLSLPVFEFGIGLTGSAAFKNLNSDINGVGIRPAIRTKVSAWGTSVPIGSGLVLPGATRDFAFNRAGSYFGILPVTATDAVTGAKTTTWVIAVTGVARLVLPLVVLLLLFIYLVVKPKLRRKKPTVPINKPLDGLSRRPISEPAPVAAVEPPPESKLEELESQVLAEDSGLEPPVVEDKPEPEVEPVKKRAPKTAAKKPIKAKRKPKKDS